MTLYRWLVTRVTPPTARWLCVLWYAALIAGVVILSVEPPAEFRYGRF